MPSTFIFGSLNLKMRICEMSFPKSIVYSDAVLYKLRLGYKSFFPGIYAESLSLKIAEGLSLWVLKFSRLWNYSELRK